MIKDQLGGRWEVICTTEASRQSSPDIWVFKDSGDVIDETEVKGRVGRWTGLEGESFSLQLTALGEFPGQSGLTGRIQGDEFSVYWVGFELLRGVRKSPEAEKLGSIHEPWVGTWVPATGRYTQCSYRGGRCISESTSPVSDNLILNADGRYSSGPTSGTWCRTEDGRMGFDLETGIERYYAVNVQDGVRVRIGPHKRDGSRFEESVEYTFYERRLTDSKPDTATAPEAKPPERAPVLFRGAASAWWATTSSSMKSKSIRALYEVDSVTRKGWNYPRYSSDGKYLLLGSRSWQELRHLESGVPVHQCSVDGSTLFLKRVDAASRHQVAQVQGHSHQLFVYRISATADDFVESPLMEVAPLREFDWLKNWSLSSDGRYLVVMTRRFRYWFDLESGRRRVFARHAKPFWHDATFAITGQRGLSLIGGFEGWFLLGPDGDVLYHGEHPASTAGICPNGRWAAISDLKTARFIDLNSGASAAVWHGSAQVIRFSPDSRLAALATGPGGEVHLLDTESWHVVATVPGDMTCISFSADSRLFMTSLGHKERGEFPRTKVSIVTNKGNIGQRTFVGPGAYMGAQGHILVRQYQEDHPHTVTLYGPRFRTILATFKASGYCGFDPTGKFFHTQQGNRKTQVWRIVSVR